jgi:hypothetical protein
MGRSPIFHAFGLSIENWAFVPMQFHRLNKGDNAEVVHAVYNEAIMNRCHGIVNIV